MIDLSFLTECSVWSVIGLLAGIVLGYILRVTLEQKGRP